MSFVEKLKGKLRQTRRKLGDQVKRILRAHPGVDQSLYDDLEEALIGADVGVGTTEAILDLLRTKIRNSSLSVSGDPETVQELLIEVIEELMVPAQPANGLNLNHRPAVILIVGVNGSGKTTSIAKLAHLFQKQGKRVLLAAADTFRAAATEQLAAWGERLNVPIIRQQPGADPAAVAFDAFQAARARRFDLLIVDTAGRLHNKANLMQELAKIARVLKKQDAEAPHEVLLVLDATTGQNALQQAKIFQEISGVSGLVLAKLDGTAKGGAVISICRELNIPLRFIGLGESLEDLEPFDPKQFARAIFEADPDRKASDTPEGEA